MNKVGQIIERGLNRWLLRVYVGRDANGKRQYRSKMFEGTKVEARKALAAMNVAGAAKALVNPNSLSLSAYLKSWLASKVQVSASTLHGYKRVLALYVEPTLGLMKLQALTPALIQDLYNGLSARNLSPRVVEFSHAILRQAFAKAVKLGFLVRNPAIDTERPAKKRRPFTILSLEQMVKLLAKTKEDKLYPLWLLLLNTGLRPGEALALRWSDLDGDTVRIAQTLVKTAKGNYEIIENHAKTDGSMRPVTLPASVLVALKAHRLRTMRAGGYMFPSRFGGPRDMGNVRRAWKAALKKAELPTNIRLYDTRHSHATALLNAGNVNLAWVSQRLGHTSVKTTEQAYTQVLPEAQRSMADTMESILKKAASK